MDREQYSDWIRNVRKEGGLTQADFGRRIYHFEDTREGRVCRTYHRNEVISWEKGERLPSDTNIEAFISIAILDYRQKYAEKAVEAEFGNQCLLYVKEKMREILKRDLYSRDIHEALLVEVCRGVLSFEEILGLEEELEKKIQEVRLDLEEKRKYASHSDTVDIERRLEQVIRTQDIHGIVEEFLHGFYTANRTLGVRWQQCFEKRDRYPVPLSFGEAVQVYAPRYRDSFKHMFTSRGMSRDWILDLCVHLRFNREEIQYILDNAHMSRLSDDPGNVEAYYVGKPDPIGSKEWYQALENSKRCPYPGHYACFKDWPLREKLKAALLINAYVEKETAEWLPPIDYLLESFSLYDYGQPLMKKIDGLWKKYGGKWSIPRLQAALEREMQDWVQYLQSCYSAYPDSEPIQNAFLQYRNEFWKYFNMPASVLREVVHQEQAVRMKYFSALLYTIFYGKYFEGTITRAELLKLKVWFQGQTPAGNEIYPFFNQLLVTFLSKQVLYEDRKEKTIYFTDDQGRRSVGFHFPRITAALWEAYQKCTT